MSLVKLGQRYTMVKKIQSNTYNNRSNSRRKMLIKERGNTVGAWGCHGVHLLQGFLHFRS